MRSGAVGSLVCSLLIGIALLILEATFCLTSVGRGSSAETIGYGLRSGGCQMANYAINPFAIYRSPIGIFLAGLNVQDSNQSFHLGIPVTPSAPFQTMIGHWLSDLYKAQSPPVHVHVSAMLERKDLSPGERLQFANADRLVDQKLEFAYLLDPTNAQVMQPLVWRAFFHNKGASNDAIIDLINATIAAYHTNSGRWPEHNLYAADALITKWNMMNNPRGVAMESLLADVDGRLKLAARQKSNLEASGDWNKRLPYQRKDYDESAFYLGNFRDQLEAAVGRNRASAAK